MTDAMGRPLRHRPGASPAAPAVSYSDLPEPALRAILLGPSDSLPRFLAACARVCAEWRRVVMGSAAYGLGTGAGGAALMYRFPQWGPSEERAYHHNKRARVLKATARALKNGVETLRIDDTVCGDDGLVALAAALPALTGLWFLGCSDNPAAGARGWVALAGALPSLPALDELSGSRSTGMGSQGGLALAAAVPQCPRLTYVSVDRCGLDEQAKAALRAAAARVPRTAERPNGLHMGLNSLWES